MYRSYAPIYRHIGQHAWSERMARWAMQWLQARNVTGGHVIDWGCGDGAAARVFAAAGWQVTGVDRSRTMLALARKHTPPSATIRWLEGDLRVPNLVEPGTLATAFYDTLNYLPSADDLYAAWRTMAAGIVAGGYVIADVNTPHEYLTQWRGQHVITADSDDVLVINRLRYNVGTGIARGKIVWFARNAAGDQWRRGSETHVQRAHTQREMEAAIAAADLQLVELVTPQGEPPTPTATRIIYIAQKS